jgi:hypothetical protein
MRVLRRYERRKARPYEADSEEEDDKVFLDEDDRINLDTLNIHNARHVERLEGHLKRLRKEGLLHCLCLSLSLSFCRCLSLFFL